jgi:NAD(P)-dependent dehydrogenase (short-subunit alcohol dehydrogenase family)
MDLQLTDKRALVTGSTAGIGYAIASLLAREGAAVIVNGRTAARTDQAVTRIQNEVKNPRVTGVAADLSTKDGVARLIQAVPIVDVLVNNLGIYEAKDFPDITDEDWLRLFEVNVLSGVRLSRFYLPKMLRQDWGRIVFISSESALNIPAEMIHYGVTKTAQVALARGLADAAPAVGHLDAGAVRVLPGLLPAGGQLLEVGVAAE